MVDLVAASTTTCFSFGPFHLLPGRHLLLDGETPVRLGSRAFEILVALVERRGELVSKDALIARVWPSTHIAEGNLKFQVAGLRRALGDGRDGRRYIVASPGQGYRFVAAVSVTDDAAPGIELPTSRTKNNLPVQLTHLIGRTGVVSRLVEQLATQRLLTIVGFGGIGKTVVALALAEGTHTVLRTRSLADRFGADRRPSPGADGAGFRAGARSALRQSAARSGRGSQREANAARPRQL